MDTINFVFVGYANNGFLVDNQINNDQTGNCIRIINNSDLDPFDDGLGFFFGVQHFG